MGQDQQKISIGSKYSINQDLLESLIKVPNSFPQIYQTAIQHVNQIHKRIPPHPLQQFFIQQIKQRFQYQKEQLKNDMLNNIISAFNISIKKDGNNNNQKNQSLNSQLIQTMQKVDKAKKPLQYYWNKGNQTWSQLQTSQKFMMFLKKVQQDYHILNDLDHILSHQNLDQMSLYEIQRLNTVRKNQNPIFKTQINQQLFARLFPYYYILILKKCWASSNKQAQSMLTKFHRQIGQNLLQFLKNGKLSYNQLFVLTYCMIYIERHLQTNKIKQKLFKIFHFFKQKCLQNEYKSKISQQSYDKFKRLVRCYLDQLYLISLNEAEDPELGTSQSQLMPLKGFPINRVKQKNR